jgi:heat-inducible transcriptional repressor
MLTDRQEQILRLVVGLHLETGKPVGSRAIADLGELDCSPSTIRSELAALEETGYLMHPHTSAGRVPTDSGYRCYVDSLLASGAPSPTGTVSLETTELKREIDAAMRETTTALAQVTDLMALVTAPPLETATIHRVEALRLQPQVVMVIVITSAGAVTKRLFTFDETVDPGLVEWASSYLNERLSGMSVGARMIAARLADPGLGPTERDFVLSLTTAFTELPDDAENDLYVDGTSRLLSHARGDDLPEVDKLMTALDARANVLGMLRSALDERSVFLWIGEENPQPELRYVSVVGANYGLGHRNLGSVGVLGPLRMDYEQAISSVRGAARELSRYFETVYEG